MADIMEFPKTMKEFVDRYSFKDSYESYTNNARLIPVFRVEQAIEHYDREIRNKTIDDFAECIKKANETEGLSVYGRNRMVDMIAKQLKGGAK